MSATNPIEVKLSYSNSKIVGSVKVPTAEVRFPYGTQEVSRIVLEAFQRTGPNYELTQHNGGEYLRHNGVRQFRLWNSTHGPEGDSLIVQGEEGHNEYWTILQAVAKELKSSSTKLIIEDKH